MPSPFTKLFAKLIVLLNHQLLHEKAQKRTIIDCCRRMQLVLFPKRRSF